MSSEREPYHGRNVYGHEASGRRPMRGRFGGGEETTVAGELLDITPEIRERASYLSPYRMDHIAELHANRMSVRELEKTLFPSDWSDDKIFEAVQAVASDPSSRWTRDEEKGGGEPGTLFNPWHKLPDVDFAIPARFRVDGVIDNVKIRVVVEPYGEGVISAYTLLY